MQPRLIAIGLACSVAAIAASHQAPAGQNALPAFRGDARLVRLSVVVHGKDGKPIDGLTRDDFTLYEDGKPQRIELFSVEADRAPEVAMPALPAGDFSNRLDARARGSATAIVFDRLNTLISDQRRARDQLVKFLGTIRPEDRVGVYVIDTRGARMLHDFTNDSASLLRTLSAPIAADRPPEDPELAMWLSRTVGEMTASISSARVSSSSEALIGIARHMAGVQGRKNLVWVSSGVPMVIEKETMLSVYNQVTRYFDDMNIAIYPVQASGLVGPSGAQASDMPSITAMRGDITSVSSLPEQIAAGRGAIRPEPNAKQDIDAMQLLAANTGGRAFFNTNDISRAVRTAIDDGQLTYVLGYYPSHGKWDGTFRKLEVKVNRTGVDVRHRNGYMAFPALPERRPPNTDELLAQARSPFAATGVGLTAHATRDQTSGDVILAIHVDPEGLTIEKTATECSVSLALAIAQRAPDGAIIKSTLGDVGVSGPIARYEQLSTRGFSFDRTFPLAAAVDRVHIVIRDEASGAIGSLIIPVERILPALRH